MTDNAATSTSTNVYRIEPLTGAENYAVWKIKMIDILTGQDLWEYVDGTTILPTDTASQSGWRKKDRLALSMIRLRVADKMLVYVASLTSAREAWETLNSLLEAQGALGIVLARRKLFRAQCAEGTTIEEHIRTLHSYQEELHNLGQKIDGEEFSIILLSSLPESWNTYISSIDTTSLKEAPRLIAHILEHDWRMGMRGMAEDTALAAKPWKKKINPNITCYGCGKKGHISHQCRSGKGKLAGDQKGSTTVNAAVEDDFAFCGDDLALMASLDSWLSDSACTSHIARNKSHFITYVYGYSWTQNLRIWKCSWTWTRNHQVGKHCQWKISHHNSKRSRSRTRCTIQPYFHIKGLGNRHQGAIRFQIRKVPSAKQSYNYGRNYVKSAVRDEYQRHNQARFSMSG